MQENGVTKTNKKKKNAKKKFESLIVNQTALHWVCKRGYEMIAKILVYNGANLDSQDVKQLKIINKE